ncbi:MAG TPA: PepSY-associated TM helix domain-containing protein [Hyphomicrobiaceae bacterium]|nr:PepSY-associated TM helix domain-containing protein [Hyphomicrobiaceae bacterium]
MKPLLLRLHRWIALASALPLAVVVLTALVLSFEPMLNDRDWNGRSISLADVEAVIAKHDPAGKASTLNVRAYENVVMLASGKGGEMKRIDLATNQVIPADRRLWSDFLTLNRRLHESLLLDLRWLVDASTIAMVVLMLIGLGMGLPFLRNTLGGWHRATAWGLAPLLLLSPLTGLAIAYGITLAPPGPRIEGPPVALREAVQTVAKTHDLANVIWIRPAGGATRVRVYDRGQAKVLAVTKTGLVAGPQSWPRLLHEGVWAGAWSGLLNVVVSIALVLLMTTGMLIWLRRTLRRRSISARPVKA